MAKRKFKALMDDMNKALCVALREAGVPRKVRKSKKHLKQSTKPMPFSMMAKKVRKTNGRHPTAEAVSQVVEGYYAGHAVRGRL